MPAGDDYVLWNDISGTRHETWCFRDLWRMSLAASFRLHDTVLTYDTSFLAADGLSCIPLGALRCIWKRTLHFGGLREAVYLLVWSLQDTVRLGEVWKSTTSQIYKRYLALYSAFMPEDP